MDTIIKEIGARLRGMREILDIEPEEMAKAMGVSKEDYLAYEEGEKDISFTFLYHAVRHLHINLTELLTCD